MGVRGKSLTATLMMVKHAWQQQGVALLRQAYISLPDCSRLLRWLLLLNHTNTCAVLCCAVLCYAVLCCAVLCCAMLW